VSTSRRKRPAPERTQPLRNWSTLFSVPTAAGADADPDAAGSAAAPRAEGMSEVISRSVDLGYRVIDEYIRQGQKAAVRLNDRSYGTQAMASDLQDLGMRMTQYASDFAAVWLEFVQLAARSGSPAAAPAPVPPARAAHAASANSPAPAADGTPRGAAAESDGTRVRIEVVATQPTEVSLDIRPAAATGPLLVHALRAVDPDKPRLTEVSFEAGADDEPPRLRIRVPGGQPPGVYSGLIIDERTSRPAGTVSVRIGDA
jgi:hypothetical protein